MMIQREINKDRGNGKYKIFKMGKKLVYLRKRSMVSDEQQEVNLEKKVMFE